MTTKTDIQRFFDKEFPNSNITVESVGNRKSIITRKVTNQDLRPGGTVSGPFMMALADASLYCTIFGEFGLLAMAVTTNLNINFLSKPAAHADVVAECNLIKVGSKLVVGEVSLYSKGQQEPIAHAVGTYSIPS